jgi:hypothetical protein
MVNPRIKIFENTNLLALEKDVNHWLSKRPEFDEILSITPTQSSVALEQTRPVTFGKDAYEIFVRTFYTMTVLYRSKQPSEST